MNEWVPLREWLRPVGKGFFAVRLCARKQRLIREVDPLGSFSVRWKWANLRVIVLRFGWWRWRVSVERAWMKPGCETNYSSARDVRLQMDKARKGGEDA